MNGFTYLVLLLVPADSKPTCKIYVTFDVQAKSRKEYLISIRKDSLAIK